MAGIEQIKITLIDYGVINYIGDTVNRKYKRILKTSPFLTKMVYISTGYLPEDTPILIRLHCIVKCLTEQPKCKSCGGGLTMRTSGRKRYTFGDYCNAPKCFAGHTNVVTARRRGNVLRSATQKRETHERRKRTLLSKYGVDNPKKIER